jgi:hypothetical protein
MKRALPALWALALSACATAQVFIPPEQASRLERTLAGEERYLRVSLYVTPFFGDATRRLLTDVPPDEVDLLANPGGGPVNPGAVQATFAAGTLARIKKVEFPSPAVMAERVLYTPRTLAWVYVDVAGAASSPAPLVLVLPPGLKTDADFDAALDRLLTRQDPRPTIERWSEAVKEAVRTKNAVVDMPAEALEMAWGYPVKRKIALDAEHRTETWTWAFDKRTATLVDGRVTKLE